MGLCRVFMLVSEAMFFFSFEFSVPDLFCLKTGLLFDFVFFGVAVFGFLALFFFV